MPFTYPLGKAPWETNNESQSFPAGQAPWETQPVSPIIPSISSDELSQQKYKPLIPATTGEGPISAGFKTLFNIPSSGINFIKGAISFFNPLNTSETSRQIPAEFSGLVKESGGVLPALIKTAKELPHTAYEALVPEATRQIISGDTEGAQRTLENDPVGQILPYILVARGVAEKIGKGAEFDAAISKIAAPPLKAVSAVGRGIGNLATQIIGAETGAGASSANRALNASETFRNVMRGKVTPEETINNLENAFQTIKDKRAEDYLSKFEEIGKSKQNLDISPIYNEFNKQLNSFLVKDVDPETGKLDFSRSTIRFDKTAQADIQHIYDVMKDYGTTAGDRTPIAVDSLKRAFGDLYSPSSNVRSFTTAMKNAAGDVLKENVPQYAEMTKGYAVASDLLDDIRSATGIGGRAKADAIFTKVTTALKADKEFRLQFLNELENGSGVKLVDALAGHNLSKWIPSGIIGRGIDVSTAFGIISHVFNPSMIPLLLTTSPRIMGEFLNAVGIGKQYIAPILQAVNKLPETMQGIDIAGFKGKAGLGIEDVSGGLSSFKGFSDLTTKFLDYAKGKTTLSKQEILDFAKRPELKKGEADLLNTLGQQVEGKIPAQEFAGSLRGSLLELKPIKVKQPQYANITIEPTSYGSQFTGTRNQYDLSGKGPKNYEEIVFESPITTDGSSHYPNSKNYFAHARGDEVVEGGKKIWREQEIQSDLLQKDRLDDLRLRAQRDIDIANIAPDSPLLDQYRIQRSKEALQITTGKNWEQLQPFTNDRFGERIMRERIREKAQQGYSSYRLPTGETVGRIEGFENPRKWYMDRSFSKELTKDNMKVGQTVIEDVMGQPEWVVTSVGKDGAFKVIHKQSLFKKFPDIPKSEIENFIKNCL